MEKAKMTEDVFLTKVRNGEMRKKYGLETDGGSRYYHLTVNLGLSDVEAQASIFRKYVEIDG